MRYFPAIVPPPGLTGDDIIGYADPETANSYEIGMKGEFFDNRLRLNTSLFYVDYEDFQTTLNVDVGGPLTVPTLSNAGTATIEGVELEVVAVPTDWLDIQASLGYMDAEYKTFTPEMLNEFPNADTFIFQQTPEMTLHLGGQSPSLIMILVDFIYAVITAGQMISRKILLTTREHFRKVMASSMPV